MTTGKIGRRKQDGDVGLFGRSKLRTHRDRCNFLDKNRAHNRREGGRLV
jgi:hypothetical protein